MVTFVLREHGVAFFGGEEALVGLEVFSSATNFEGGVGAQVLIPIGVGTEAGDDDVLVGGAVVVDDL